MPAEARLRKSGIAMRKAGSVQEVGRKKASPPYSLPMKKSGSDPSMRVSKLKKLTNITRKGKSAEVTKTTSEESNGFVKENGSGHVDTKTTERRAQHTNETNGAAHVNSHVSSGQQDMGPRSNPTCQRSHPQNGSASVKGNLAQRSLPCKQDVGHHDQHHQRSATNVGHGSNMGQPTNKATLTRNSAEVLGNIRKEGQQRLVYTGNTAVMKGSTYQGQQQHKQQQQQLRQPQYQQHQQKQNMMQHQHQQKPTHYQQHQQQHQQQQQQQLPHYQQLQQQKQQQPYQHLQQPSNYQQQQHHHPQQKPQQPGLLGTRNGGLPHTGSAAQRSQPPKSRPPASVKEYEDVSLRRPVSQASRGLVRNRTYDAAEGGDRRMEQLGQDHRVLKQQQQADPKYGYGTLQYGKKYVPEYSDHRQGYSMTLQPRRGQEVMQRGHLYRGGQPKSQHHPANIPVRENMRPEYPNGAIKQICQPATMIQRINPQAHSVNVCNVQENLDYMSHHSVKENVNPNVQRRGPSVRTCSPIYEVCAYENENELCREEKRQNGGRNVIPVNPEMVRANLKIQYNPVPLQQAVMRTSQSSVDTLNYQNEIQNIVTISTQHPDPALIYTRPVDNRNEPQRAPSVMSDWSEFGLSNVFQEDNNGAYTGNKIQQNTRPQSVNSNFSEQVYSTKCEDRTSKASVSDDDEGGFVTQPGTTHPHLNQAEQQPPRQPNSNNDTFTISRSSESLVTPGGSNLNQPNVRSEPCHDGQAESPLYEPVECAGQALFTQGSGRHMVSRRDVPPSPATVATLNRQLSEKDGRVTKALHEEKVPPINKGGGGLRVTNPADLKKDDKRTKQSAETSKTRDVKKPTAATATTRSSAPRRHTVGGAEIMDMNQNKYAELKEVKQREAFFEHLAYRYPEHADLIKARNGNISDGRPSSALDNHPRRRQTTVVTYNPDPNQSNDDNDSVMSEIDTSATGFRRGGRARSSLPIVRDPSKSLEKPIGLVFLTFRGETKRALLPNEITSLDTVRALFVRSFPDHLSMANLEGPNKKIYMLDAATNVYYELEQVKEIKDRTVLKVYEKDGPEKSPRRHAAESRHLYNSGHESDSSTASSHRGAPRSPVHPKTNYPLSPRSPSHANYANVPVSHKTQSLPVQPNAVYQDQMRQFAQYEQSRYTPINQLPGARDRTASPSPQGSPLHGSPHHRLGPPPQSPSALSVNGNQRHSVAYIPQHNVIPEGRIPQSRSYHDYNENGSSRSGSSTPVQGDYETATRMIKMETQLANLTAWVQTAVMHTDGRPGSARSHSSIASEGGSYSVRSKLANDSSQNSKQAVPLSKKAPHRLSAPPRMYKSTPTMGGTFEAEEEISSGISDISSSTPQPIVSVDMQNSVKSLNFRVKELRSEWKQLRRMQQTNSETMHDTIQSALKKIQDVLSRVPGADDEPIRVERTKINSRVKMYKSENEKIIKDLGDLEISVEELRADVLNKHCRVNMTEVEAMALQLSQISKALAELKARFPLVQDNMKMVMAGEMEIVVKEERFMKEEPERIDGALKRCKKLTGTLFTLKKLASVQENRTPHQPNVATNAPQDEERKNLLDNIQAMVPNHEARVQSLEAADASRERKKKLQTQQETLKFEKSLEMASKNLRGTQNIKENEQRMTEALRALHEQENVEMTTRDPADGMKAPASLPLTDTTKRVSTVNSTKPPEGSMRLAAGSVKESRKETVISDTVKRICSSSHQETTTVNKKTVVTTQDLRSSGQARDTKAGSPKTETDGKALKGPAKPPRSLTSPKGSPTSTQGSVTHVFTETIPMKSPTTLPKPVMSTQEKVRSQSTVMTSVVTSTPMPSSFSKQQRASHVVPPTTSPIKPVAPQSPVGAEKVVTISSASKPPQGPVHQPASQSVNSVSMLTQSSNRSSMIKTSPQAQGEAEGQSSASKDKNRKVPPPPPPRRSSRTHLTTALPLSPKSRDSEPPTYENIEKLGIVPGQSQAAASNVPIAGYTQISNKAASRTTPPPKSTSSPQESAKDSQRTSPGTKPLSRFQKDLMAGLYANINRPDLQEQKINHETALSSPQKKVETVKENKPKETTGSSDSESTSSVDSQQGVTMRRNVRAEVKVTPPKVKSPTSAKSPTASQIPRSNNNGQRPTSSRESLGKKVPPPPPVRKSSVLSSSPGPSSPNIIVDAPVSKEVPNKSVKNNQNGSSKTVANGAVGKKANTVHKTSKSVPESAKSATDEKETDIF